MTLASPVGSVVMLTLCPATPVTVNVVLSPVTIAVLVALMATAGSTILSDTMFELADNPCALSATVLTCIVHVPCLKPAVFSTNALMLVMLMSLKAFCECPATVQLCGATLCMLPIGSVSMMSPLSPPAMLVVTLRATCVPSATLVTTVVVVLSSGSIVNIGASTNSLNVIKPTGR